MDIKKRTLKATEKSVLENDLVDIQDWVDKAIDGKNNACKKRMVTEWLPKLYADSSVTSIPANEDDIVALVVARSDYKTRKKIEDERIEAERKEAEKKEAEKKAREEAEKKEAE